MLEDQGTHQAEEDTPEQIGLTPGKLKRLANLRPPWRSETAPRHGGRASDGGGTKDHPIRATLRRELAKRRNLRRLVASWIEDACNGDAQAREQILKRLDPVLEESAQKGPVLQGLKLELTHRGVSMVLAQQGPGGQELREISALGVPEGGLEGPSVTIKEYQESHLLPESHVLGSSLECSAQNGVESEVCKEMRANVSAAPVETDRPGEGKGTV